VRLRARLAVLATFVLALLGLGAGVQANAAPHTPHVPHVPNVSIPTTANNGCVVVPSLHVAVCLARL
jgi:hypothetical protein